MSWRRAGGATVLPTLVGLVAAMLSSLAFAEPAELTDGLKQLIDTSVCLKYPAVLSRLRGELATGEFGAEQPIAAKGDDDAAAAPSLAQLVGLSQFETANCNEAHFGRALKWRDRFLQTPLGNYIKVALIKQRRVCYDHLYEQTQMQLDSLSKSTRKRLESFVKKDNLGSDFYASSDMAIAKLRQLVGSTGGADDDDDQDQDQDQLKVGQDYLRACQELTGRFERLRLVRADYETFAMLPTTLLPYFRFEDFCRLLIEMDFSYELSKRLFLDVEARELTKRFGLAVDQRLGALGQDSGTKSSAETSTTGGNESEQHAVASAAMQFAEGWVVMAKLPGRNCGAGSTKRPDSVREQMDGALNYLRKRCASILHWADNLLWLRRHDLRGLNVGRRQLTPAAERQLRSIEACKQLGAMDNEAVIELGISKAGRKRLSEERWKLISDMMACLGHGN
jgi:hypothetical protein